MTYELNQASDYSTGDAPTPSRDEIEAAVLDFDDANNGYGAIAHFLQYPDYEIRVSMAGYRVMTFDSLWEFTDWAADLAHTNDREKVSA